MGCYKRYGFCPECGDFFYAHDDKWCSNNCNGFLIFEGMACRSCGFVASYDDLDENIVWDQKCPNCGDRLLDIQEDGYDYVHAAD